MKTYHLQDLLKKEVLIIELPRLCDYDASARKLWVKDTQSGEELTVKGSWGVLGKPDEIREDDAGELVDKREYDFGTCYRHYSDKTVYAKTATESLLSAIETVIFWDVNPYRKPDREEFEAQSMGGSEVFWKKITDHYNDAELRTFDRNRTLILVKN